MAGAYERRRLRDQSRVTPAGPPTGRAQPVDNFPVLSVPVPSVDGDQKTTRTGVIFMCMHCDGWTDEEIRAKRLHDIESHGWSITYVEADDEEVAFAYTIGLTRYHGHPELLVSGLDQSKTVTMLNSFGDEVRRGTRYSPGDLVNGHGRVRFQFAVVDDPRELVDAQETYASAVGLVPGLQIIYSDGNGHWPWECGGTLSQPLFGTPQHQ
jgi:Domain of unknown function (DUF4262)